MTSHLPPSKRRVPRTTRHASVQRRTTRARAGAFSLVEVTLAMGIMGFAFVSLLGLMPVGLNSFREAKNINVASQIAQQIFAEVQSTPFTGLTNNLQPGQTWRLPAPGTQAQSTALRYFDEQGQEISSTNATAIAGAIYQVNVRVAASTPFVQNGSTASTPAPNPALANVAIQIAYNPGNLPMNTSTSSSDPLLWTGRSGSVNVPMFTYETLVARNF